MGMLFAGMVMVVVLVALACGAAWWWTARARRALLVNARRAARRIREEAELDAACIVNAARLKMITAEDEAAQIIVEARTRSGRVEEVEVDEITGVYQTVRPQAQA